MALSDMLQAIEELSPEEFEALYTHVNHLYHQREGDRRNEPLDIVELKQIFADLREGFDEADLQELTWAMSTADHDFDGLNIKRVNWRTP